MSDREAADRARLTRVLRAMGLGWRAVVGRLVYAEAGRSNAALVAALRAASPILLGEAPRIRHASASDRPSTPAARGSHFELPL